MVEGNQRVMYMSSDTWSPRYDATFFTIKIDGHVRYKSLPNDWDAVPGKSNLPAFYYQIDVYREHQMTTVMRRYSQFRWLYWQLQDSEDVVQASLPEFPPATWIFWSCGGSDLENFADTRREALFDFLDEVLLRPEYANHPALKRFLGL